MKFSRPVNILLVEDNEADVFLTVTAFKKAKIANNVEVANDAETALQVLKKEGKYKEQKHPDMILVDVNLPGLDGFDLLFKIKNMPELKTVPVIMLTGSDSQADLVKAYEMNASSYIVKPVNMEKFHDVIKAIEHFWFSVVMLPNRE